MFDFTGFFRAIINDPHYWVPALIIIASIVYCFSRWVYVERSVKQDQIVANINAPLDTLIQSKKEFKMEDSSKQSKKTGKKKTVIEDNRKGNFNEGQKGGHVIQNYYERPPERHMTDADISLITKSASKDVGIVFTSNTSRESLTFRDEIVDSLKRLGYRNIGFTQIGMAVGVFIEGERITVDKAKNDKGEDIIEVKIHPQN